MDSYIFPIKIAFITFPFLAILFTLPFIIFQYRKYGYINKFRVLMLYSFLLFLLTSYYLVILPLPNTRDVLSLQSPGTQHVQLVPFTFIRDFFSETSLKFNKPSTFIYVLKERAFLQAAFNAILLMPLGIYLRYYFKRNLKQTFIITFLVSLFFELTQLTGLYGIYNAPYRIFDVDDLMLNTLGGYIGYLLAPLFVYALPKTEELDGGIDIQNLEVGYIKRFFAYFIDWAILGFIPNIKTHISIQIITVFIYFILIAYLTNGKTIGKGLVGIKVKGKNDKIKFKELFIRYGILYYGVFGINNLLLKILDLNQYIYKNYIIVIFIVLLVYNLFIFIIFSYCVFKKNKTLFYERYSGTKNVNIN
jgi:glycopeptide antibiotics resistance protein